MIYIATVLKKRYQEIVSCVFRSSASYLPHNKPQFITMTTYSRQRVKWS